MKKTVTISILVVLAIAVIIALIPFIRHIPLYFAFDIYGGGPQYAKECVSDDGHIKFICYNKYGLYGIGSYMGVYTDDTGKEYEVDILIDGSSTYARTENDDKTEVFYGQGHYSVYRKAFIVKVEEVDLECSVYKPGDKIIIREK